MSDSLLINETSRRTGGHFDLTLEVRSGTPREGIQRNPTKNRSHPHTTFGKVLFHVYRTIHHPVEDNPDTISWFSLTQSHYVRCLPKRSETRSGGECQGVVRSGASSSPKEWIVKDWDPLGVSGVECQGISSITVCRITSLCLIIEGLDSKIIKTKTQ